ncbi:MAG: ATP-binding protein [Phycisphaerales bacterium]|nr:ATP-binding protein [Phycisphaerales bacterium]
MLKLLLHAILGGLITAAIVTLAFPVLSALLLGAIAGGCAFMTMAWFGWLDCRRIRRVLGGECVTGIQGIDSEISETLKTIRAETESTVRNEVLARRLAEDRAESALRVLSSLDDPVIVIDDFGEVVEVNEAAVLLGRCDAGGKPSILQFLGDRELADNIDEASQGIGCGEVRRLEHEVSDAAEGAATAWEISIRRLDPGDRWVLVLHDVTRDREVSRLKSEFVTKASHELRTPLSSIHAYAEMLVDGEVDDGAQRSEFLRIVHEESARLARLVDNMLDISRIEAGVATADRTPVDLGRVAGRVVEAMRPRAKEREIDLVLRADGDDLTVEGDEDMLAEVLENLVGNAVKYTPDQGRVAVSIDPDGLTASVVTTVTDTGLGIPPGDLDRLFEKFYRIGQYERMAQGTGLGLNLCRNIVEKVHQGRIGVDSTLGMGSRFWFSVPVRYSGSTAA